MGRWVTGWFSGDPRGGLGRDLQLGPGRRLPGRLLLPSPPAPADHAPGAPTLAHLCHAPPPPAPQVPRRPALKRSALSIGPSLRPSSSQPMAAAWEGAALAQDTGVISLSRERRQLPGQLPGAWTRAAEFWPQMLGWADGTPLGEFQHGKASKCVGCRAWRCTPFFPALRKLRQED